MAMTREEEEEEELLRLTRENNQMLHELRQGIIILSEFVKHDSENDLFNNVVANILAKRLEDKFGL